MTHKAFLYRMYPNKEQEQQLQQTFGCVRFVYNRCLDRQEKAHASGEKYLSRTDMNNYCNRELKPAYPFLREVDKFALTNAIFHLDDGYQRKFQGLGGNPKYKSKHKSRRSYTTNITNGNIAVGDRFVKLPKLGKVKAVIHRPAPEEWKLKSATVSQEHDGTYYCSILFEYENITQKERNPSRSVEVIGLDYKSDGLYVDSEGRTCGSPKYYRKAQKRLAKLQKDLSRKQGARKGGKESNNHKKQKKKVAKLHRHIANQRKDFLHKQSTGIANRYDVVCVEDLDMRAMSNKGFGNGKATLDNGYGMFLCMLEYKLADRGKVLIRVGKWYPSSQVCSHCGFQNPGVKALSVRRWECPVCGARHDRDLNAAVNIREEGVRLYRAEVV